MKKMLRNMVIGSLLFVAFVSYIAIDAQERNYVHEQANDQLVEDIEPISEEIVLHY